MAQIQVNHLTFYYEGSYEEIFNDVSFSVDTDWKLGFIGRNGRGKTTFLNLLMGKYEYRGTISAPVEFEYFPFAVRDKSRPAIDIVEELYPCLLYTSPGGCTDAYDDAVDSYYPVADTEG